MIAHRNPIAPGYSSLTITPTLILDATGLRDNTDNTYGQVTAGAVQIMKGIAPGNTGLTFSANAVGALGESSAFKFQDGYVEYPGYAYLKSQQTAQYDPLSYNTPVGNLKNTIHMVLRMGQEDIVNFLYGFFGNNAGSAGNRGTSTSFEDRPNISRSNGLTSTMSKGTAGFIIQNVPDNLITPNVPFVYSEETDMSQAAANRRKHYINGVLFAYTAVSPSTAVTTQVLIAFDIGAVGGGAAPLRGWFSHFIWQPGIESSGVFNAFVQSLMPYTRKSNSNYFYTVDESKVYTVTHTLATAGQYYFVQGLLRDPANANLIYKIYHNGTEHVEADDKKVSAQISTDGGRAWGAEFDVYDDDGAGTYAVQDGEWGIESDGTIHGITDWHTTIASPGGAHKLLYHRGANIASLTTFDITSILPADGLNAFRAHGEIIEGGDGYLYASLYKTTDENSSVNCANYVLRKPVGASTTWTVFTVQANSTLRVNEMSMVALDASTLLVVSRNETTGEWNQFVGTSNGSSWTDQGALTFGESRTTGSPPLLNKLQINGVDVIEAVILDKDSGTKTAKVVYGTAANLIANGLTGWDLDTKTTFYSSTAILHYLRLLHKTGNMNSIGAGALEPVPPTLTANSLVTFHGPAFRYYYIKTELGIAGH